MTRRLVDWWRRATSRGGVGSTVIQVPANASVLNLSIHAAGGGGATCATGDSWTARGGAGGSASRRLIDGRWYVSIDGGRTYTRAED